MRADMEAWDLPLQGCGRAGLRRATGRRGHVPGLTILELLVVVAIIALMIAIVLPAIQSARESARDAQCRTNLRQLGIALHAFHESHRMLPAGWVAEATRQTSFGWAAFILPQLQCSDLGTQIDPGQPILAQSEYVRSTSPLVYLCPSDSGWPTFPLFAEIGAHESHAQESEQVLVTLPRANYVGVFGTIDPDDVEGNEGDGVFVEDRGHTFGEIQRGLSHVLLVGERTTRKLPSTWLGIVMAGEDAAGRVVGHADLGPNRYDADECEFDSRHYRHVNFLWTDGHVSAVRDDIHRQVYRDSARRR